MTCTWLGLGACCFALAAGAVPPVPAPVLVPVGNAGFEQVVAGQVAGWTLAAPSGAVLRPSDDSRSEGLRSLRIDNPAGGAQTTVVSQKVALQVGQLYRLSAWVKTRGVQVDPQARYPTALGACLSMKSFPFTNASATVAGDGAQRVSVVFFATASSDAVQLHLGRNGKAGGSAWFDDVRLEKVDDIAAYVPMETVRWAGRGFRYDDGGWIVLHIEGAPYDRGRQYGELVPTELARFVEKLAILQDKADPAKAWHAFRAMTDITLLRKYDAEYLEEMKGIADGAAKAGAKFRGRALDLLDIVAINSAIDISEMEKASSVTATALTGRSFTQAEADGMPGGKTDRCSSFVATKSTTPDGRFIMGQMFMWPPGYTGVDWNVMVDVQPTQGHRFVMQTFPGGISSGADWYVNDAGIVIGETTVAQTPYDADGTPEANRSRKAAQYGASIDEVAAILTEKNNGLYTNDWTIADTKTDEGAVFLLGTHKTKMWRTGSQGHPADTPGQLKDFVWADNNNRDLEVRKEMVPNADNNPVDLAWSPFNRDLAFWDIYKKYAQGKFDLEAGVAINGSSPVNRPHACDGKLTTAEMAEKLMFIAHYGNTSTREKWVGGRFMADLPLATPHLTQGFTAFSPIFVADKLKAAHQGAAAPAPAKAEPRTDQAELKGLFAFPKTLLWSNTVFPASEGDNWFVSGSAAYHSLLRRLPEAPDKAQDLLRDSLGELNARYAYSAGREGALAPAKARTAYDGYAHYQLPRIKGTFLLHQLRLLLGNAGFSKVMNQVHSTYQNKNMTTGDFIRTASAAAGRELGPFIRQWVDRDDLPNPAFTATVKKAGDGWDLVVKLTQAGEPYHFVTTLAVQSAKGTRLERVELKAAAGTFTFHGPDKATRVVFNPGGDVPVPKDNRFSLPNQMDDYDHLLFVHGTTREVEVNRSLLLNYRELLADNFLELLPPVKPDAQVTAEDLAGHDLVVFGAPGDNGVLARMAAEKTLPVTFGKGFFRFRGKTYGKAEDGLAIAVPNPYNPKRTLYLYTANSPLQLWHMTHLFQRGLPEWVLYQGAETVAKGFRGEARFDLDLN